MVTADQHFQAFQLPISKEITDRIGDASVGLLFLEDFDEMKDKVFAQMDRLPLQFLAAGQIFFFFPRRRPWLGLLRQSRLVQRFSSTLSRLKGQRAENQPVLNDTFPLSH